VRAPTPGWREAPNRGRASRGACVIGDGEAVRFVANALDEMQDRRAAVEDDGLVLLAVEVDDFFALGNGGEGLGGQPEGFEGFGGGVELADSAVDED